MTKQKTLYTLEVVCCNQILFAGKISKASYKMGIEKLLNQAKETENDETKTEYLGEQNYTTPLRKATLTSFLRGTTFIDFEKSEWF